MKLGAQPSFCRGHHGGVYVRVITAGSRPKGPTDTFKVYKADQRRSLAPQPPWASLPVTGQVLARKAASVAAAAPTAANFSGNIVQAGAALITLAATVPAASAAAGTAAAAGGYVPSPVQIGWEVWVGAAAGVIPFIVASYEFGKRILIQRRCPACKGSGLIRREGRSTRYVKCKECGGMLPWLGWSYFFFSAPGNGGPLLQPRGQSSIFYKVPPPPQAVQQQQQQEGGQRQQQRHGPILKADDDGAAAVEQAGGGVVGGANDREQSGEHTSRPRRHGT